MCVYAALCLRHIDHIRAAPIHHIKRETPAETAIQPRERHKQRTCVCAWHSLKGERLIGFLQTWQQMQQKCSKNAAQKVMQLALVAYGRIAHARNKAEGLRRQYLNVPSPLFFSNMT